MAEAKLDTGINDSSWIGIGQYWPREPFRKFHIRTQRWAAMVCHRRAGKTVGCVADLVLDAKHTKKQDARFAYVAPQFNQAKDVAWIYVKRLTADIQGVELNESELRADFPNGARVRLYGADNPDRLRGLYLDGCILDEYADMRPSVWGEVIRPMLMDRQGWAAFIGTPKGRNEFFRVYDRAKSDTRWFSLLLKASESGLISQQELDEASEELTPEQYEQELECSFDAAIVGAYYGKELVQAEREGRIKPELEYDPYSPVHTAWDLGVGDDTAIWFFQCLGPHIYVLDYYESRNMAADHYCKVVQGKPWYTDKSIAYVPHDAKVREWAMEGHADGKAKQRIEVLYEKKMRPSIVKQHNEMDGINAVRLLLPRMWFDASKCAAAIETLRQFQTDYDEKLRKFKDNPRDDWTNHCADAFRYMAMAHREMQQPPLPKPKPELINPKIGQLASMHDKRHGNAGARRI